MKMEIRADGLHLFGYVNVTGKMSRPVITGNGQKVIEMIEERAFQRALEKAKNVPMTLDHNADRVVAETGDKTLKLCEDAIGLRAEALVTDKEVIQAAKDGKLKGWSFGMKNIIDAIVERAGDLPLRRVKELDLDHVTIVMNKTPCYAATLIETRADDEEPEATEMRTSDNEAEMVETSKKPIDYSKYDSRILEIESGL